MAAQFSSRVDCFLSNMEEVVQLADKYCADVPDLRKVSTYTNLAKEVCEAEVKSIKISSVLEERKEDENIRRFDEAYQTALEKSGNTRNKNSKKYLAFQKYVKQKFAAPSSVSQAGSSTMQEDDVMLDDFVSTLDPITKKPLVHPVKNKRCGHHYEKESILEMIATNRHLRCPVSGCGDKAAITQQNLVDDPGFEKLLQERQKLEEESD